MADILKGAPVAAAITEKVAAGVQSLKEKGINTTLEVIRVGEDPSDLAYERGLLKRMEKQGYITRIRPETNENKLFVELTEAGDALKDQATEVPCQMEGCLKLDQAEQRQLKELLDKAIMKMEA